MTGTRLGQPEVRQWRLGVLAAGLVALVLKLTIAAHTYGTTDVFLWQSFADSVRVNGPVGIYGQHFALVYNHAPLSGWMLVLINALHDHIGLSFQFLIRVPASLADVGTGLLVFEFVRRRRSLREAAIAASLTVLSPILIIVSGFHGNTDPVFVMLAILSAYLLAIRSRAVLAGAAFGLALSVKLVPVVVIPTLLVLVLRAGRAAVLRYAGGLAAIMVPLWLPVVLTRWTEFNRDVLGYAGVPLRQWGLVQLFRWLGLSPHLEQIMAGHGRFLILAVCGLVPAALAWRRRDAVGPAIGLTFVLFLLLTPAFGMQYLAWAVAAAYLINTWAATAYNLFGSLFAVTVYDHWNNAYPWHWNVAGGQPFRTKDFVLQVPVWLALAAVAVTGLMLFRQRVPWPRILRTDLVPTGRDPELAMTGTDVP